ncbi:hypothetical protein Tco_0723365 [Tanacetum coccineum]
MVIDVSSLAVTSLKVFNNEFNRMGGMDDDLFTYEVKLLTSHIRRDDEVELTDEESSDNEDEVANNYLLRTLRDSRLMKNLRTTRFMDGTMTYLGWTRNLGLTQEYEKNRNQSNILASLLIINLDIQNDQHVVGRVMDNVMEETYLELT